MAIARRLGLASPARDASSARKCLGRMPDARQSGETRGFAASDGARDVSFLESSRASCCRDETRAVDARSRNATFEAGGGPAARWGVTRSFGTRRGPRSHRRGRRPNPNFSPSPGLRTQNALGARLVSKPSGVEGHFHFHARGASDLTNAPYKTRRERARAARAATMAARSTRVGGRNPELAGQAAWVATEKVVRRGSPRDAPRDNMTRDERRRDAKLIIRAI